MKKKENKNSNDLLKNKKIDLILKSMDRNLLKILNDDFSYFLDLKLIENDSNKLEQLVERIIGKEGWCKEYIKKTFNVDLEIDSKEKTLTLSSPNIIKKQIAVDSINQIVKLKSIDKEAIDSIYKKNKDLIDEKTIENGKDFTKLFTKKTSKYNDFLSILGKLKNCNIDKISYFEYAKHFLFILKKIVDLLKISKINELKIKKILLYSFIENNIAWEINTFNINERIKKISFLNKKNFNEILSLNYHPNELTFNLTILLIVKKILFLKKDNLEEIHNIKIEKNKKILISNCYQISFENHLFIIAKNKNEKFIQKQINLNNKNTNLNIELFFVNKGFLKNKNKIRLQNKKNQINNLDYKFINYQSNDILLNTIQKNFLDVVSYKNFNSFVIENKDIIGSIIGLNGENKKIFEKITSVALLISDKKNKNNNKQEKIIKIESINIINKKIAYETIKEFILNNDIYINETKILEVYNKKVIEFNNECIEIGKNVLKNILNFKILDKKLCKLVGILNFRSSYNQNVLKHCLECGFLAYHIALKIDIDPIKARNAAFFHDIGKATDFEINNDHVTCGVDIAKEFKFDDYIINAIESHHGKVPSNSYYSDLVKIVDKISAARPAVRQNSNNEYLAKKKIIFNICKEFEEITSIYMRSRRQLIINVNPNKVTDKKCEILIKKIVKKIEEANDVNKQPIDLILKRESIFTAKTRGTAELLKNNSKSI